MVQNVRMLGWGPIRRNRHALEGDIAQKNIGRNHKNRRPVGRVQRFAQEAAREVSVTYPSLSLLEGCSSKEQFYEAMSTLSTFVDRLVSENQFRGMEDIATARAFKSKIRKAVERDDWDSIKSVLALRQEFEITTSVRALHGIDLATVESLNETLKNMG